MMFKISMLTFSTSSFIVSFMGFANTAVSPQTDLTGHLSQTLISHKLKSIILNNYLARNFMFTLVLVYNRRARLVAFGN